MRRLAAALIAVCLSAAGNATGSSSASTTSAANAETGFAVSLLQRLAGDGNVVYSPFSIYVALAMADAGAGGQTAAQIDHVLGAVSHTVAISDAAALTRELGSSTDSGTGAPLVASANGMWTQSGLALEQPFVATLTNQFGAPPRSTDFASSPDAALAAINSWVAAHTERQIRALLGPGSVGPETAFVLANAIYLKALWAHPFSASLTQPAAFTTADGQVVRVPFMNEQDASLRYASGPGYQAVALPYSASSLSLLAIEPRGQSLGALERGLTAGSLASIAASLAPDAVTLALPKLDLSTQADLDGPLEDLGMRDAFRPTADFRAMTTQRALDISLVEHAATLKLDEQGTVASGATAILGPTAIERPPGAVVRVRFDRPYLLILRDDRSGLILFVAQVENPRQ